MTTTTDPPSTEEAPALIPQQPPQGDGRRLRKRFERARDEDNDASSQVASAPPNSPPAEPPNEYDTSDQGLTPEEKRTEKYERLGLGPSKTLRSMREDEDKGVAAWIKSLDNGDQPIRVNVHRKEPREFFDPVSGQRKKVDGMLRRYERAIDEEELQRNHGGGTFQIVVHKRDAKGQWTYFAARTIEVAGDPLLNDVPRNVAPPVASQPAPPPDNSSPVMTEMVRGLIAQANRPQPTPAPAPDITAQIRLAVEPYIAMITQQNAQLAEARKEASEARKGDPAAISFQQKMLDKFVDQDSVRLQAVRAQFESEIRQLKDAAIENEKRIRDGFDRDKEHIYRGHERELATTKSASDLKVAALEQSFAMQKTVLESDNRRLERELVELRQDVKDLRNKKEPSFKDQIAGLRDMKDVMSDVLGDDEKEEKSTVMKVVEGLAQSDVVAGFAQRVMGGAGGQQVPPDMLRQQQMAMQAQAAQQQQRRRGPRMVRDRRNGQVYATDGTKAIPVKLKQPLAPPVPVQVLVDEQGNPLPPEQQPPPQPPQEAAQEVAIPYVPPENVATAVDYMQKAHGNNVDPGDFATGVKMFVPPEILETIRQMGVERFLKEVGGIPDGHPLLTQGGKNWCRKVARNLVGE